MRAGTFVEIGRVVCTEAPEVPPQSGDLVVRSELASICGSDLHIVMDGIGGMKPGEAHPGYPGHEGVGEVIESHDPAFETGDRVLCAPAMVVAQCFAEIQTIPARHCTKLPETTKLSDRAGPPEREVSAAELLMAQQLGTVIFAHRQFPVDVVGKTVAVVGAGSAGQFHAWWMKRRGARKVIAIDPIGTRLDVAASMGADVVVDSSEVDPFDAVQDETGGAGADFVIEAVGRPDALLLSTRLVGMEASLLWFGLPDTLDPVPIDFNSFFRKKLRAASAFGAQFEPDQRSFAAAVHAIAQGDIDVSQVLSHTLPIERVEEAIIMAHERTDGARKVAVSFS